jgi:hypothetical protein
MMPTFIRGIIVGGVRAIALAAVVVAATGCGSRGQRWPDCLRILGATHVRVATPVVLARSPKVFAAERAAAIAFSDGVAATLVVSRTAEAAARTAAALGSIPSIVSLPLPTTLPELSAVLRRGNVVLQWFGRREPARQQTLFDCATT